MSEGWTSECKHRLPRDHYLGRKAAAFTACLQHRHSGLADPEIVEAFRVILERASARFDCTIPIYTFMPDHLHVLVLGESDRSDSKATMDTFKFSSGWWLYRHRTGMKWQKDYWDHVVREREGWQAQARYIAANPCRAGLCEDVHRWPYTGSIGYDLSEVLGEAFW